MKEEWYLIVLWERARSEEERILADIRRHVEIVATFELAWPGKADDCFARFYGAKAKLAAGKERHCGSGPFCVVIVKDTKPRYGWRQTSRGSEWVNARIFAMKSRYRRWTGGGHKVHTTNTECETRRDIFLLTGHSLEEWKCAESIDEFHVLPTNGNSKELSQQERRSLPAFADAIAAVCQSELPLATLVSTGFRSSETEPIPVMTYSAMDSEGNPCEVSCYQAGREALDTDWKYSRIFYRAYPEFCIRPMFYRLDRINTDYGIMVKASRRGKPLNEVLKETLSLQRIQQIAQSILSLARALRKCGISCRNISPATLMVDDKNQVFLKDYRFATQLDGHRTETEWLAREPNLLMKLGAWCGQIPGVWNDAISLGKCVELLERDNSLNDVTSELTALSCDMTVTVQFSSRYFWRNLMRWIALWRLGMPNKRLERQFLGIALWGRRYPI